MLTDIRPLQARQPAPRAAPAAIPPSHNCVPTPPSGQALASTIASRASPRTDLVRELLGSPPAHAAKAVAEAPLTYRKAAMAEANTTMGDLFGESSGDEEVVAPAAAVPDPPKARRRIIDDDDDDDEDDFAPAPPKPPSPKPDASMSDLFGADSDEDQTEKKEEAHKMEDLFGADSDEDKPAESKHRMEDLFGDDDEDEPVAAPVEAPLQRKLHPKKRVLVKGDKVEKLILPETPAPSSTAKAAVLRVPKFVAFEQSPWDPDKPQKDYDEGQAVLRWRLEKDILTGESMLDENNKPKWTSNGRLVKWSDGSMQLIVGSERYDIVERPMKSERLCLQAKPKSGAMCLVSQKALETEMRLRPPSLSSEAHKAFSLRTKKAVVKAKGVKEFFATSDPEMDKRAREKQKDEEIRREARRKAREARGNYSGGGYGGRAAAGARRVKRSPICAIYPLLYCIKIVSTPVVTCRTKSTVFCQFWQRCTHEKHGKRHGCC